MARAASAARELQDQGVETPLVVVFGQRGRLSEIESGLPALVDPTGGAAPVTVVVAERYADAKLAATPLSPLSPPFDARIAFDSGLVAIGHLPAIHPLATVSSRLVSEVAGERHCRVAAAAREALASHRELVPDLGDGDPDAMSEPERLATARARRLQAYLTQPFLVTESFTGKLGEEVELGDTLSDVEAILNGACDEVPLGKLPYRGRLGSDA
jgi:F-type H+-transporting ATPase subunit beta